jgi:hypothetical protein
MLLTLFLLTTSLLPYSVTLHNTSEDPVTFVFNGYTSSTQERGEIARHTVPGTPYTRPSGSAKTIILDNETCIAKVEVWSADGDHQLFPDGLYLIHPEGCNSTDHINHITYCAPPSRSSNLFYTKTSDDYNSKFNEICGSHNI